MNIKSLVVAIPLVVMSVLPSFAEKQTDEGKAYEEIYRSTFFVIGGLAKAATVCDKHSKLFIKISIDMATSPEAKAMFRGYPNKVNEWMEAGVDNFNTGVMEDGVKFTCDFMYTEVKKRFHY